MNFKKKIYKSIKFLISTMIFILEVSYIIWLSLESDNMIQVYFFLGLFLLIPVVWIFLRKLESQLNLIAEIVGVVTAIIFFILCYEIGTITQIIFSSVILGYVIVVVLYGLLIYIFDDFVDFEEKQVKIWKKLTIFRIIKYVVKYHYHFVKEMFDIYRLVFTEIVDFVSKIELKK